MGPNTLMLAENLSERFCKARFLVGINNGKQFPTWELTSKKDRKILIETFAAILGAGDELQFQENLSKLKK